MYTEGEKMAASCARRTLVSSSASATTILSRYSRPSSSSSSIASGETMFGRFAFAKPTSSSRFSRQKLPFFSRLPVELGCVQSLMPLHSVTASSLLTSMLSMKAGNWGWLSEDPSGMEFLNFIIADKLPSSIAAGFVTPL
ncbi:hypothetical protein HHK36_024924 [Tetracentron sinense]|uniref:Uncharacterized protein n=1 Tax=Tetracentron sinense TaxID=13715 RepID=A0A834YPY2_TETSI|nr:hypothetical protein HHK36_024924 [Tetracentron sinense]